MLMECSIGRDSTMLNRTVQTRGMQSGWTSKYDRNSDVWEQQVKNKWKAAKEQLMHSRLWEVFGHLQLPCKEHYMVGMQRRKLCSSCGDIFWRHLTSRFVCENGNTLPLSWWGRRKAWDLVLFAFNSWEKGGKTVGMGLCYSYQLWMRNGKVRLNQGNSALQLAQTDGKISRKRCQTAASALGLNRGRKVDDRGRIWESQVQKHYLKSLRIASQRTQRENRAVNPSLALRKEKKMLTHWQK